MIYRIRWIYEFSIYRHIADAVHAERRIPLLLGDGRAHGGLITALRVVFCAAALGIVNGFGDGRFSPNGYINREQVAAALCRAVRYIEGETGETILPASADLTGYADADQVSPWAADSMAALTAAGLLQGTSGATLSPKDTTTVEQAILLALRAWQAFAP